MIKFNDGKQSNSFPFFEGAYCTIYGNEPNTSGFVYEGLDCSDYCLLYRKGDDYYQLTNNSCFLDADPNEVPVPAKKQVLEIEQSIAQSRQTIPLEEEIKNKKEELASTDYIIIKMAEGADMSEYDIDQIKADRQVLRDEINALETQLKTLTN